MYNELTVDRSVGNINIVSFCVVIDGANVEFVDAIVIVRIVNIRSD